MASKLNVNVKISYIHAEKLVKAPPPKLGINIQISLPSEEPKWNSSEAQIPFIFNLNSNPPAITVTLKGQAEIRGEREELNKLKKEVGKGRLSPQILQLVTSYTIFEAMLLMRELGFPPVVPLPPPAQGKKPSGGPVGPL